MLDLKLTDMGFMYLTELKRKGYMRRRQKVQEGKNISMQAVGGYA